VIFVEQALANLPATRSWRDIPQPVKPRAMSRGGRWRRLFAAVRIGALMAFVGAVAWGGWMIASALRQDSHMPAVAKSMPVRAPELKTTRDGVLDDAWLARTLALPARVSLMELDLEALRVRLLADGQVFTANLTRQFPDRLIVHVTERSPVARRRLAQGGH
jgi:cell division septal protein FtsQ